MAGTPLCAFLSTTNSLFFHTVPNTIYRNHNNITTQPRPIRPSPIRLCYSVATPNPFLSPITTPHSTYPTHLLTIVTPTHTTPATELVQLASYVHTHHGLVHPARHLAPHALEAPITLPATSDVDALRTRLFRIARTSSTDAVLQHITVARAHKRLAVFDLDSTLIAQETIDELASELNVQPQCKAITESAMNGQIGFREALAARVALLKGLPVTALDGVKDRVRFTPGARELIAALRQLRCTTAVVSGGFHFLADHVRDVLGLDYSFANRLEADSDDVLTGRTVGEIVDAEYKENTLRHLANMKGLSEENILAVGDGSNDLLMMHRAGLGVAFNAKPIVQDRAKCRVNQTSLKAVLYLLGQSDDDIDRLLAHQLF